MSSFSLRPHFSQLIELDVEKAQARIIEQVESAEDECELKCFPGFLTLRIPEAERHFWSPRLTLSLEADGQGHTQVTGIYGPNAKLWSLFLYGWLIVGSALLFSGILAGVQLALGNTAWGLWIFCPFALLAIGLYVTAQMGQKLGASQTRRLHHLYEAAMGRTEELH
ncbi:MAG: hypothetical protein R3242_08850 [Akkermansiaceae bacterium]|nr:hypothetical protein [Akkermansiaceae bacterium]